MAHNVQVRVKCESAESVTPPPAIPNMASASPVDPYGHKSAGSAYGSGQSDGGKSPLSMSLGFLKNLTEKKSTRGRPSWRRARIRG